MSVRASQLIWITSLLVIAGGSVLLFISFFGRQNTTNEGFGDKGCQSNPNPLFVSDVTDLSKIKHIAPPVTIQQTGVKTHGYIFMKARVPIYAPVDSVLVEGAFYDEEGVGQYWLMFQVSCEVFYMFDHIGEPVGGIKANFSAVPANDSRTKKVETPVRFKAGDLIGYTSAPRFGADFGVYNTTKQNPYADLEPAYKEGLRFAHAVCPFEYFPQDKKQFYSNLLRNVDGSPVTNSQSLCFL